MKVLLIEDEPELANSIIRYLEAQQYSCELAADYPAAMQRIASYQYDCILLDLMLPGGSGMEILSNLKSQNIQAGLIIISAKDALADKITGLELGADDYLAKPFHLAELSARVYSIIRRRKFDNVNIIKQAAISINLLAKTVHVNTSQVLLTRKEFDLLLFFVSNKNRVVSKSALAEHLSGDLADMLDNHDFIYAHIKNLKRKLQAAGCENYLKTVYGNGYRWEL